MIPRSFLPLLAALLVPAGSSPADSIEVIDDFAIEHAFNTKLGVIAEAGNTLTGKEAMEKALKEAAGHKAVVPPVAEAKDVENHEEDGVVIVGTVVKCKDCGRWESGGNGSGWVLSADGLIMTNHHVVAPETMDKAFLGVMDHLGHVFPVEAVVADDPDADVAVLRVACHGVKLHPLRLATRPPSPGKEVHVIGHPDGRYFCLSKGYVTRYHRQPVSDADIEKAAEGKKVPMASWMSVSADFGVGSSGGPVFDAQGRVVGMACLSATVVATDEDAKEDTPLPADGVQMVFKDCVPLSALRAVVEEKK